MRRLQTCLLLCLLLPVVVAQDAPPDPAADWAKIQKEFVPALERLQRWCDERDLRYEGHRLAAVRLHFEPENEAARRLLKYRKQRDGTWKQGFYRMPKKSESEYDADFALRWETAKGLLMDPAFQLLERDEGEPEPRLRGAIVEALLAVAPEDEKVRELSGEVKHEGQWLLFESVNALTRRQELIDTAKKEVDAVDAPVPYEIAERTKALGAPWAAARKTSEVKVVTTTDADEAAHIARIAHASGVFARSQLRMAWRFPFGYEIHVVQSQAEYANVLARIPDLDPKEREFSLRLAGTWIDNVRLLERGEEAAVRIDMASRQTIQMALRHHYKIDAEQAWVMEGVGLYLSGLVCGTRLTWFVAPSQYANQKPTKWKRQMQETLDWLPPAKELMESNERPSLRHVLRRHLSTMTETELLVAFAFAAYLIEGRPDDVRAVLRAATKGRDPSLAIFDALGMDERQLTERFLRWLRETVR